MGNWLAVILVSPCTRLSVFQDGLQSDVGNRGGKDAAANGQDFARNADGLRKIAGNVGERGKKQIAKIVAGQPASGAETILEQSAEQRFVFGQRHHAIANVAGRKDTIFAAQAAGAATVIGDGDDCGQIDDGPLRGRVWIVARNDMQFQSA